MSLRDKEFAKFLANIVTIVTLPLITGMFGWVLLKVVNHESRLSIVEFEQNRGERYTAADSKRDFGVAFGEIGEIKENIHDHEIRLRTGGL